MPVHRHLLLGSTELVSKLGYLLVTWAPVSWERSCAVVAELLSPTVDEAGRDAEVSGSLQGVAEVVGETDGLTLVLGREGASCGRDCRGVEGGK